MPRTQRGSFIHVLALWITEFSPLMLKYLSARRICISSSPKQSLSGQIVCLSVSVFTTQDSLQDFRVIQSTAQHLLN